MFEMMSEGPAAGCCAVNVGGRAFLGRESQRSRAHEYAAMQQHKRRAWTGGMECCGRYALRSGGFQAPTNFTQ